MSSNFIEISVDELRNGVEDVTALQSNVDWALLEIGEFYRSHDRELFYTVVDAEENFGVGMETTLAKYGIYLNRVDVVEFTKTYLFLLTVEELLHDGHSLMEIRDASRKSKVEIILSDLETTALETVLRIYNELDIENCVLLNRVDVDSIYSGEEDEDVEFLDFSEFGTLADNTETSQRLNAVKKISEYVRSVGKNRKFAIALKDLSEPMSAGVFDGLVAAYLPRGYQFHTNSYQNRKHFEDMIKMYSREYMKIVDYFDGLREHLNFGVYVANEADFHTSNKYKRCDLFLVQIGNDSTPQVQMVVMPIKDGVLVRQSRKVALGLNDFEYEEIDPKFLPYADQYLADSNILTDESLHCSNTFCLKMGGEKFLAVFTGFGNTMRCKVAPVCGSIVWADVNIPFEKYSHVLPITIFDGGLRLAKTFYKDRYDKIVLQRQVAPYMDYFPIVTMQFKTGIMDPSTCEVPEDALGLYFVQSSAVRTEQGRPLFKHITKRALWDMGFLTYYGGPLPSLRKNFIFKYEDLR